MDQQMINHDVRGIGMTSARTRDRLVQRLQESGIRSSEVLEQIRNVPRHLFVDEALASRAYEDTALPIGLGQTISQPYVVARMTEALLDGLDGGRILEIGTGCGYQTAAGIQATRLGFRHRSEPLIKTKDPQDKTIFWIGPAGPGQDAGPGTDFEAIEKGQVSVTPLKVDLTWHEVLPEIGEWIKK